MGTKLGSVLIVEDDPLVLMNYSEILEESGFVPTPTASVEQAWNTAQNREFDIVLCDHDLGDGKGWDLIRKLNDCGKKFPVIYLSAAVPKVLEEVAALPLVQKVLAKPVSPAELLKALRESIRIPADEPYPKLIGMEERVLLLDEKLYQAPSE
ncbi:MAG: hypothetical protein A2X49_09700 [Lentisphaerae bacterium GWF2_52_8]|nr:MAG: hypothetical protein A2X49_09700 [Lentisphaerae bacterium GWF2_52_8]